MWPSYPIVIVQEKKKSGYGFFHFLFDAFMTCITGGFWLIYVFVREMRKRG